MPLLGYNYLPSLSVFFIAILGFDSGCLYLP